MKKNTETGSADRMVTQDDVAKHAGVSRSMVSYVLNGGPRPVAEETRLRIIDSIRELGYRPNKTAQKLIKSQYDSVAENQFGIIMSDVFMFRRPYYAAILAGIHDTAHANNRHVRFIRFFQDLKDPVLFNELIHKEEISGLILIALDQSIASAEDENLLREINGRIHNIICIEWEVEGLPSVMFNRQEAAYKATKHLVDIGIEELLYIGPQDNRVLGFQQALLEAGLLKPDQRILYGSNLVDGRDAVGEIVRSGRLPRGIVGGTDEVSMGLLRGLSSFGIRVPDTVALVSIDNIEMSAFTNPPLTTVNVNTFEMGKLSVETLINRSKNPGQVVATIMLPTQLVIRESCRG